MDQQIRDRACCTGTVGCDQEWRTSRCISSRCRCGADRRESKVIGFEALARWIHPVRGFVSPGVSFRSRGERLIVEMASGSCARPAGAAFMAEAAADSRSTCRPRQFTHGDLVGLVHSILLRDRTDAGG